MARIVPGGVGAVDNERVRADLLITMEGLRGDFKDTVSIEDGLAPKCGLVMSEACGVERGPMDIMTVALFCPTSAYARTSRRNSTDISTLDPALEILAVSPSSENLAVDLEGFAEAPGEMDKSCTSNTRDPERTPVAWTGEGQRT